jgi:hypothetical protein
MPLDRRRAFLLGLVTGVMLPVVVAGSAGFFIVRARTAEAEQAREEVRWLRRENRRLASDPRAAFLRSLEGRNPGREALQLLENAARNGPAWSLQGPVGGVYIDNTQPVLDQMHRDLHDPFHILHKGDE